jgi:hypothetical protein
VEAHGVAPAQQLNLVHQPLPLPSLLLPLPSLLLPLPSLLLPLPSLLLLLPSLLLPLPSLLLLLPSLLLPLPSLMLPPLKLPPQQKYKLLRVKQVLQKKLVLPPPLRRKVEAVGVEKLDAVVELVK